jgi:hypothetical protein
MAQLTMSTQESFTFFQKDSRPVTPGTLSALVHLQRQELLTGLVAIAYPGEEQALLLFNLGAPFGLYYLADGVWRKIPSAHWNDIFSLSDGDAVVLPLSGNSLRILLLALESGAKSREEVSLRPAALVAYIEALKRQDAVSILRVRDDDFQGVIVFPGRKLPVQDMVLFSPSGVLVDASGLARLTTVGDRLIRVSKTEFDELPPFLQEYAFRVVFLSLSQSALKRFDEMAGDSLTESLGLEINQYASHQGWQIQFFGKFVSHRQFFSELGEATLVYRSLYKLIRHYLQRVVGAPLASSIVGEGVGHLPISYREVFERQNFIVG